MDRSVDTAAPIADAETARPSIQDIPDFAASVADAQRGNPDAFRVLCRDIHPRLLLRYLPALVGDDAEDVASDAWLHVARDLHAFNGDYDGFRGWVTTIARHRALDHLRRHSGRPPSIPVQVEELADLAARMTPRHAPWTRSARTRPSASSRRCHPIRPRRCCSAPSSDWTR